MIFIYTLVSIFLSRIRFPRGRSIHSVILSRYGRETLNILRQAETTQRRYAKSLLDCEFLQRCLMYDITPKFVRFKLYRRRLLNQEFYKEWQRTLLEKELEYKKKASTILGKEAVNSLSFLRQAVSILDYNHVKVWLFNNIEKYRLSVLENHKKKMFNLGGIYCNVNDRVLFYKTPHRTQLILTLTIVFSLLKQTFFIK